jgi:Arc/MetJ-type ribon-helix-helix transcriptional regulator
MEVSISEEATRFIQAQLAAGRYRTPAELIDDLVRLRQGQEAEERGLAERQRGALLGLLDELKALPVAGVEDDLTNRDHDRILYSRAP